MFWLQSVIPFWLFGLIINSLAEKWRKLFDPLNTGEITFDDFCRTLGISKKKKGFLVTEDLANNVKENYDPLVLNTNIKWIKIDGNEHVELLKRKQEVVFYDTNMTEAMKDEVLLVVKQHYDKQSPDTSMHPTLMQLDETFGPRWTGRATTDVSGKGYPGEYLIYSCDGGDHKYVVYKIPEKKTKKCCPCC